MFQHYALSSHSLTQYEYQYQCIPCCQLQRRTPHPRTRPFARGTPLARGIPLASACRRKPLCSRACEVLAPLAPTAPPSGGPVGFFTRIGHAMQVRNRGQRSRAPRPWAAWQTRGMRRGLSARLREHMFGGFYFLCVTKLYNEL